MSSQWNYSITTPETGEEMIHSASTLGQARRDAVDLAASHHKPMVIYRVKQSGVRTFVERFEARAVTATPEQLARNAEGML